jgi:hypothetical protein
MRFNPNLPELVPASQLDAGLGGGFAYDFEPVSYWEQVISCAYSTLYLFFPSLTGHTAVVN